MHVECALVLHFLSFYTSSVHVQKWLLLITSMYKATKDVVLNRVSFDIVIHFVATQNLLQTLTGKEY